MAADSKRYLMIQFSSGDPSWIDVVGEYDQFSLALSHLYDRAALRRKQFDVAGEIELYRNNDHVGYDLTFSEFTFRLIIVDTRDDIASLCAYALTRSYHRDCLQRIAMEKRKSELEDDIVELEETINMHTWTIADKRQRLAELDDAIATYRIV